MSYAITPQEVEAFIAELEQERSVVSQLLDEDTSLSRAEIHKFSDRLEKLRQLWGMAVWLKNDLTTLESDKGEAEERLDKLFGYGSACDGFAMASKLKAAE